MIGYEGCAMEIMFLILMVLSGIFAICGAVFNWDFFFQHRKARRIVAIFGRNGARIFYALLGGFVIFCGIMFVISVH